MINFIEFLHFLLHIEKENSALTVKIPDSDVAFRSKEHWLLIYLQDSQKHWAHQIRNTLALNILPTTNAIARDWRFLKWRSF